MRLFRPNIDKMRIELAGLKRELTSLNGMLDAMTTVNSYYIDKKLVLECRIGELEAKIEIEITP